MTLMRGTVVGMAAGLWLALACQGAAHAVTRSAAEVGDDAGGIGGSEAVVTAKPPTIAFKPSISVLPSDTIGVVIHTNRTPEGGSAGVSVTLRLGGVDLSFGPGPGK